MICSPAVCGDGKASYHLQTDTTRLNPELAWNLQAFFREFAIFQEFSTGSCISSGTSTSWTLLRASMIVGPILSNSPVLMQPCRQGMHRILSKEGNHRGLFNVKKKFLPCGCVGDGKLDKTGCNQHSSSLKRSELRF